MPTGVRDYDHPDLPPFQRENTHTYTHKVASGKSYLENWEGFEDI